MEKKNTNKKTDTVRSGGEIVKSSMIVCILKAQAIAFALNCLVFIVYAIILTYTNVTEKNVPLVSLICMVVSSAVAGFDTARGAKNKGLLWGVTAGIIYSMFLFAILMVGGENFTFNAGRFTTIIIAIAGGGIGGVLGVNLKK